MCEFSLDNHAGALCNLLAKLTDHQGKLRAEFQQDLDGLVKEFSLDDESSALSRLVGQVERAQRGIVQQFSLDDDASALSRLRKELNLTIATFTDEQRQFQTQISKILTTLEARKDAEARSTTHGLTFENQLGDLLCTIAGQQGDLVDDVGHVFGALNRCKVGDFVITVGSDQVAAGGRIVVEAKEDKSVTDSRALSEIQRGRENREAHVGIFVFSKKVDPDKETFRRCGDDILVVWDAEEPSSDIYVQAAISVAKAILHHKVTGTSHSVVDLQELDASVAELARLSDRLNNMEKYNSTIRNSTDKIDAEIRGLRKTLEKECHTLAGGIQSIKECA